jgi:hypothetical protein
MSTHAELFIAHAQPVIESQLGDEITYGATACTAVVGAVDVLEDETGQGLAHRQERNVTVYKSDIASPAIEDEVTIGSETWQVTKIVRECESHTVVRCTLSDAREVTRRGYR